MRPDETKELNLDDLEMVTGGSALDGVPTVDEHDYDEEIRKKAGEVTKP